MIAFCKKRSVRASFEQLLTDNSAQLLIKLCRKRKNQICFPLSVEKSDLFLDLAYELAYIVFKRRIRLELVFDNVERGHYRSVVSVTDNARNGDKRHIGELSDKVYRGVSRISDALLTLLALDILDADSRFL